MNRADKYNRGGSIEQLNKEADSNKTFDDERHENDLCRNGRGSFYSPLATRRSRELLCI